ncbi:sensor histidine kinase [Chitinophaga sp. CF418]|uniref:sensor histidine kinase n=1 Tax=Chitinophaga sp. CF418 TaxID=1855287 RepID=UPI00165F8D5F|nr:histidine kinase [Chitinophaga sp. CF418]
MILYSLVAGLLTAATAFMILNISKTGGSTPFFYAVFVGVRFFLQGLVNVLILVMLRRLMPAASVKKRKWMRYSLGYLFAIIFCFCTGPLELYLSQIGEETVAERMSSILVQAIINNSLVIIIQNIIILRYEKTNTDLENSRLKAANLESANLLLKQQIHPHFLFNALSMLKSLYKADLQAGEAYLTHLVSFLRASLTEPQSRLSRLQDEIRLCNDYLEMQKIRFEDALICTINIPEQVLLQGSVPPFSIQSLIENAIKHNEVTEASPLKIKVFYENDRIIIENNLQERTRIEGPSGKGLINLIERYKILSTEDVIIRQDNKTFSVSIKVLCNEVSDHRR